MNSQNHWLAFPAGFTWGAGTAAYQVEGAVSDDGRGASIWDTFCRVEGAILNGDTGDIASDHYHRFEQDVQLMADLGLSAYRFSIAWPRILPDGVGRVNQAGLDFYARLVDALLAKGIQPFPTLYHWDLPQALQDTGGWTVRSTSEAFAHYADVISRRLGDRVTQWMTINEPMVSAFAGYRDGAHAPGWKNWQAALQASHYLLLAHGLAVPILRANSRPETKVGIAINVSWVDPATNSPDDQDAARRLDGYFNRWFLDPVLKGSYPADMLALYGDDAPHIEAQDLPIIAAPLDFLGINYYNRSVVTVDAQSSFLGLRTTRPDGHYTAMDWEIYPSGLSQMLLRLHAEYCPPWLYVTENGAAFDDVVNADGQITDSQRQDFLQAHLVEAHRAIAAGVPLHGYFVWTLLDNFEWAYGYTKRFGIVYVDYVTQRRTPKQSALWYRQAIIRNGFDDVERLKAIESP